MTKAELVARIADEAGIPKKQANLALDATVGAITDVLRTGDKITITGLGTFSLAHRAGRTGRNPRTGQSIRIAPAKVPRFRPAKGLKDAVR
jgi:DNA-binding protein HU-beta